jgi:hypothetical protein
MSTNIVDLSNIESVDLMNELKSRGYYTDLIFSPSDVDMQLESINDGRDEDDQIVLSDDEKSDILDLCFNTDWYCERMNDDISDHIINNYGD